MLVAWFSLTWLMLDGFREDLKGDIAAVEFRLSADIGETEARLDSRLSRVENRLDSRLSHVDDRLDSIMELLPGSPGASPPEDGLR